jgi:FemAB family
MNIYSHLNKADQQTLSALTQDAPFQFLPGFSHFYKNYMEESLEIIHSSKLNAFIPVRFFSTKLFKLAQILHAPIRLNKELNAKEQLEFFNELIEFFNERNLSERLIQPHPYGILGAVPEHARSCEFGTYVIDIKNQSEEAIFDKFHPKYQKAIHHTEKNGGVVRFGEEVLNDFYTCYIATMERSGMLMEPIEYFQSLYTYLSPDNVTVGVVYDNNEPIGGIFMLHSKFAALCTHAGSRGDSKLYGAMKFLHFEMMKRLRLLEISKYDLVGVRIGNNDPALEGIFRFKKGFGGDLKTGYLWKIDIHPLRARMYDFLVKIKHSGHKYRDIIDQVNS